MERASELKLKKGPAATFRIRKNAGKSEETATKTKPNRADFEAWERTSEIEL